MVEAMLGRIGRGRHRGIFEVCSNERHAVHMLTPNLTQREYKVSICTEVEQGVGQLAICLVVVARKK
jgi:hypothetical protein